MQYGVNTLAERLLQNLRVPPGARLGHTMYDELRQLTCGTTRIHQSVEVHFALRAYAIDLTVKLLERFAQTNHDRLRALGISRNSISNTMKELIRSIYDPDRSIHNSVRIGDARPGFPVR